MFCVGYRIPCNQDMSQILPPTMWFVIVQQQNTGRHNIKSAAMFGQISSAILNDVIRYINVTGNRWQTEKFQEQL